MIKTDTSKVKNKEKFRVIVQCDVQKSVNCKIEYDSSYKSILISRLKNNDIDICNRCATTIKNCGSNNGSHKHEKNENYFENIANEIQSYLLGWIAADGCLRPKTLHVELHEQDINILNLIKSQICPTALLTKRKNRNTIWITISSKQIIKDLCKILKINAGNKQNKIRLPELNSNLLPHFIRGFFEGDGWIASTRNACGIATIDPILRKDIINYCHTFLNIKSYEDNKSVQWTGNSSIIFMNHIYDNAQFKLERKYILYTKWKNK
jgi:intein/homing endonuclease